MSGNATSMIGLCQEGKSSPDALRRSAGVILLDSSPRVAGFSAVVPIRNRIPVYIGVLAGVGMELIAFAAGALIYASLATQGSSWPRTILITRWIFGLCSIDFGLNHLMDVKDNLVYVPTWMPLGAEFWIVVTGICFVLAGLAILLGIRSVLAARLLALMFLIFNIVALPPFIFANLKNHAAWGGNAFNLALVAANWILADSIATLQASGSESARPSLA